MKRIRKDDTVIILAGKYKGSKGKVLKMVGSDKLLVEGVNLVKKATKPNPQINQPGGIVEKLMPIHLSNVAIFDEANDKPSKVGFKTLEDGQKVRFMKSSQAVIAD